MYLNIAYSYVLFVNVLTLFFYRSNDYCQSEQLWCLMMLVIMFCICLQEKLIQ